MTEDDKALVQWLRWSDGWFFENPWDHVVYASDDPLEAADRIEAQAAEIERLREALEYYAQELMTGPWGIDSLDFGDVARAALEQSK